MSDTKKFKYIICDTYGEPPVGTNSLQVALAHAVTEDYWVINTETQEYLSSTGEEAVEISAVPGEQHSSAEK